MLASKQMQELMNRFGTIYVVEHDQYEEFWNWCGSRGVEIQFEGTLYDRMVFQVTHDASPEFTLLTWG